MSSFSPYSIFIFMDRNELVRELFRLAEPYLMIRGDLSHAQVSHRYALRLLEEEGGEPRIVEPAVILHDVGWSKLEPEQIKIAFGVRAGGEEAERLNRIHEREGAAIAGRILESLRYNPRWLERIISFIERHDSGDQPDSLEEKLVKDADKLWRFSPVGFWNERERQGLDPNELHSFLLKKYPTWFYTPTALNLAGEELRSRELEISSPASSNQ
ncbi:MAG: HD domain-containing protein [Desulfobacteraceae bacterium]|nr:MAG: HD domain-containing protein [Desulfobacteraceae bacterium]